MKTAHLLNLLEMEFIIMVKEDMLNSQVRQIRECSSPEQLNQQLFKAAQLCGFDYYQFGLLYRPGCCNPL